MNKQELRETLEQLRTDVQSLAFRDENSRARINQLISAIERQLESANVVAPLSSVGLDGLSSTLTQFEIEHPQLAMTLNRIVSALSSMGI
ncbi:MAG: DUF4404 family protein [Stenotrophobium sp.]